MYLADIDLLPFHDETQCTTRVPSDFEECPGVLANFSVTIHAPGWSPMATMFIKP